MEIDEAIPTVSLPAFSTVSILRMIKDAQQQHYIRHGNYWRYRLVFLHFFLFTTIFREYYTKNVKRVRKALKFTHMNKPVGRNKPNSKNKKFAQNKNKKLDGIKKFDKLKHEFKARPMTAESFETVKHLEILIFDVERNWAYGMELKYLAGEDELSRKKCHMRMKLHRAINHAKLLEVLVNQSTRVGFILGLIY